MYRKRLEILRQWKKHVNGVARAAEALLKSHEVYAFGSTTTDRLTAASDIDILVIAENLPKSLIERAKLKGEIERLANLPPYHPIQIHLATKEEVKHSSIYSKVVKESPKIKCWRHQMKR